MPQAVILSVFLYECVFMSFHANNHLYNNHKCFDVTYIFIRVKLFRTGILKVQSTLVNSKSKGPSKTLQDIRTLTYQVCSIEE